MIGYLVLMFVIGIDTLNTTLSKKFQLGFSQNISRFCCYVFINSIFACFFISLANGFRININLSTLYFSLAYALVVVVSLITNLMALSNVQIPLVKVTSSSGTILFTTLFGVLILNDFLDFKLILSVTLIICATFIPYFRIYHSNSKNNVFILFLLFINGGMGVTINKLFTISKTVTDSKSYFIMTNVVIVLISGIAILYFVLTDKEKRKIIKKPFSKKQILNIASLTAISNVASVLQIVAISYMSITTYTVTSSAMSLIASTILSKFYFKEKLQKEIIISVALSILAIIVKA